MDFRSCKHSGDNVCIIISTWTCLGSECREGVPFCRETEEGEDKRWKQVNISAAYAPAWFYGSFVVCLYLVWAIVLELDETRSVGIWKGIIEMFDC